MTVGTPTIDANGVKYYPVTSVYQGSQQQRVRVLEPTNPVPGKPRRFLYVLPVEVGIQDLSSTWSDGLEELRLLDIPNRFNMTLIAPSFNYEPWYGDSVTDPTHRMESFIIVDLVPFGDTFAQGSVPQRYLIGFSKSGNGALDLILRHPRVFNAAAAWDSPAQLNDLSAFDGLPLNFGTQASFNLYYIPTLVSSNASAFQQQNRLWVSGDQAAWTADMIALNDQLTAASIPHTWVQGGVRVHSWNSGWLDGAVTDLDANATLTPPAGGTVPPGRSGGQPAGVLAAGTSQTSISLTTDENAMCRYATTAGVAFGLMTNTFSSTGGTAQSTLVSGLVDGGNYSYYVRCQDGVGNANPDDYAISFSVATTGGGGTDPASSSFSGVEDPLSENGMWDKPGSWTSLKKNNGVYSTNTTSGARLVTPGIGGDQYSEITYDQDPGSASWPGVMTRVQSATNGSGYLAIAYAGEVRLYRTDDTGSLNFTQLASASAAVGTAPMRLRLESQGGTHRVYFNGVLMLSYTESTYTTGQPGIANAVFGGPTVKILSFVGGTLTGGAGDTVPPGRSGGQPAGVLAAGTSQTSLSLTTDENATCRYAMTAGVAFGLMTNTFSSTGGTAQSTLVTGLVDGGNYSYYVRCQDGAGNANQDDYPINFSIAQVLRISSVNSTTFTVGAAGNFTVTTTGTPTPSLTGTGTLPGGVTFVDSGSGTATLSGTPASAGSYVISIKAHNGVGTDALQSFTLTVNQAPAIGSVNSTTFTMGAAGNFTVTTTGTPTPSLTGTGTLPGGVTFVDSGNGTATLSGTPASGTAGSYVITITAHNGVGTDASQSFALTVNQAPAISSAKSTAFTVGTAGSFTVTTTGTPTPSLAGTGTLPTGVTFVDSGNGTATLSGTPAPGTAGSYVISITAHNGVGTDASQSFTLTVNPAQTAPAIISANSATFTVGTAGSFTVTTTGTPTPSLTKIGTLPGGVTFVDNGNGTATLSGTPSTARVYVITIKAHNAVGTDASQSFTLTVNQAPAISSAKSTTFTVSTAGSFTVKTKGAPTPSLTETGTLPGGVTFVDNGNGTATLSGTPATVGVYVITITAHNGVGTDASQSFTLTVKRLLG